MFKEININHLKLAQAKSARIRSAIASALPGATNINLGVGNYPPGMRESKLRSLQKQEKMKWDYELMTLAGFLTNFGCSSETQEKANNLWITLRQFMKLPDRDWHNAVGRSSSPLYALALGMAKTEKFDTPMLEIQSTLCPSYVPNFTGRAKDNGKPPIYTKVNEQKALALSDCFCTMKGAGLWNYVKTWTVHTPFKKDREMAPRLIRDLDTRLQGVEQGVDWLEVHQKTMARMIDVVSMNTGLGNRLVLAPDLQNVEVKLDELEAMREDASVQAGWNSYLKKGYQFSRGAQGWSRFALYAATTMAYGNRKEQLDLETSLPVNLFVCLERSAEIYAGKKLGVDFRELVPGHSLPLFIPAPRLRAPWASDFL